MSAFRTMLQYDVKNLAARLESRLIILFPSNWQQHKTLAHRNGVHLSMKHWYGPMGSFKFNPHVQTSFTAFDTEMGNNGFFVWICVNGQALILLFHFCRSIAGLRNITVSWGGASIMLMSVDSFPNGFPDLIRLWNQRIRYFAYSANHWTESQIYPQKSWVYR